MSRTNDEIYYLILFRRAKTPTTLEIMADAAARKNPEDDMLICRAFVVREQEIERKLGLFR